MQRLAHPTFLSACVHAQADAPGGRRIVATGGASPAGRRAERNPWTRSHPNNPAPEGRRRKLHGVSRVLRSISKQAPRLTYLSVQYPNPSPLRGERGMIYRFSTGSASGCYAATPLHPWLQSAAPPGRKLAALGPQRVAGRATSSGQGKSLTCPTRLPASGTAADTVTDPGGLCLRSDFADPTRFGDSP